MSTLKAFDEAWSHGRYKPSPVTPEMLQAIETELGIALPQDYRTQVLEFGLPTPTTALWDWLDSNPRFLAQLLLGIDTPHLSQFYTPEEMRVALGWRDAGMPEHLLPFANDSQGNQICFDMRQLQIPNSKKARVYFWDHDFLTTDQLARSFSAFLKLYLP